MPVMGAFAMLSLWNDWRVCGVTCSTESTALRPASVPLSAFTAAAGSWRSAEVAALERKANGRTGEVRRCQLRAAVSNSTASAHVGSASASSRHLLLRRGGGHGARRALHHGLLPLP